MPTLTDQHITDALLAGGGILSDAARYLSERLGGPISRAMVANRVEGSRVLTMVKQIAEERAIERTIADAKQRWRNGVRPHEGGLGGGRLRGKPAGSADDDPDDLDAIDAPNARAHTRSSRAITAATVQAERDQRLCCAQDPQGLSLRSPRRPGQEPLPISRRLEHWTDDRGRQGSHRGSAATRWAQYRQERHA